MFNVQAARRPALDCRDLGYLTAEPKGNIQDVQEGRGGAGDFAVVEDLEPGVGHHRHVVLRGTRWVWEGGSVSQHQVQLPHMLLPRVYQEIKDITPARSQTEVPRVAE